MSGNKQSSTIPSATKHSLSRLELYDSLFGQGANKNKHDETGLQSQESLNYSLQTFLYTADLNWVLAMIDIADFDNYEEKYGYQLKERKIIQIATVIKKFCENDPRKLKAFKCKNVVDDEDETNRDLFALLMYCYPKLNKCEKYISKLIGKIQQQTNELVYVGIAKMNNWETFEEWKNRAIKNVNNARNIATLETETSQLDKNMRKLLFYFSDINIAHGDEKTQEKQEKKEWSSTNLEQQKNLI